MAASLSLLAVGAAALFAGSETRLASGTTIAGVDVGGLERAAATALLDGEEQGGRAHAGDVRRGRRAVPVHRLAARRPLGLVGRRRRGGAARRRVRGRCAAFAASQRSCSASTSSRTRRAYPSAVRFAVERIAGVVDRPAVDARLRRQRAAPPPSCRGGRAHASTATAASAAIVAALSSLERGGPVRLPIVARRADDDRGRARRGAGGVPRGDVRARDPRRRRAPGDAVRRADRAPPRAAERRSDARRLRRPGGEPLACRARQARSTARPRTRRSRSVSGGIDVVPARLGRKLDVEASRRAVERAVLSPSRTAR